MILIADSGSTKCDWRLVHGQEVTAEVSTMGLNPFFHDTETVAATLQAAPVLNDKAAEVEKVYFYGAGCSSSSLNKIIEDGLKRVFVNAQLHVDHDIMGAALGSGQGEVGIACILGTGSNACFFDGKSIRQELPSLGYILGDEGSGTWYGKKLLTDYLYKEPIPAELRAELERLGNSKDSILNTIYKEPNANVYLASFAKIISQYKNTEYVKQMIHDGMYTFLQRHVCCFEEHRAVPVNFVGSIAFHFEDILKEEATKFGITIGNVIQKPIDGLVRYHS